MDCYFSYLYLGTMLNQREHGTLVNVFKGVYLAGRDTQGHGLANAL